MVNWISLVISTPTAWAFPIPIFSSHHCDHPTLQYSCSVQVWIMLPSCSLKMPIIPSGKNKMKPNLRSYFSQTSLSQPQNQARQMHWDAGSSPNSVSHVLRSTIKAREKTCLFLEPRGSWAHCSHILSNLPARRRHSHLPCSVWLLCSHAGRTQVKNGQDVWESTWPET